jgi:hypothetical protein
LTINDESELSIYKEMIIDFEYIDYSEKFLFMDRIITLDGIENMRMKDYWFWLFQSWSLWDPAVYSDERNIYDDKNSLIDIGFTIIIIFIIIIVFKIQRSQYLWTLYQIFHPFEDIIVYDYPDPSINMEKLI